MASNIFWNKLFAAIEMVSLEVCFRSMSLLVQHTNMGRQYLKNGAVLSVYNLQILLHTLHNGYICIINILELSKRGFYYNHKSINHLLIANICHTYYKTEIHYDVENVKTIFKSWMLSCLRRYKINQNKNKQNIILFVDNLPTLRQALLCNTDDNQ